MSFIITKRNSQNREIPCLALSPSSVYNRKYYDSEIFYNNQNSGVHYYEKNPTDRHRRHNRFQIYQRGTFPSDFRRRTVGVYPHCQRVLHHRHIAAFFPGQYQCMCWPLAAAGTAHWEKIWILRRVRNLPRHWYHGLHCSCPVLSDPE